MGLMMVSVALSHVGIASYSLASFDLKDKFYVISCWEETFCDLFGLEVAT